VFPVPETPAWRLRVPVGWFVRSAGDMGDSRLEPLVLSEASWGDLALGRGALRFLFDLAASRARCGRDTSPHSGPDEAAFVRGDDGLDTVSDAELGQYSPDVAFHCALTEVHQLCDLGV
jgi:hypothetical protein